MRSYIEKRLENLIGEHANGQTAIRNLEAQLTAMRETVTRINGAITLCQEALRDAPKEEPSMRTGALDALKLASVPSDAKATTVVEGGYFAQPDR